MYQNLETAGPEVFFHRLVFVRTTKRLAGRLYFCRQVKYMRYKIHSAGPVSFSNTAKGQPAVSTLQKRKTQKRKDVRV